MFFAFCRLLNSTFKIEMQFYCIAFITLHAIDNRNRNLPPKKHIDDRNRRGLTDKSKIFTSGLYSTNSKAAHFAPFEMRDDEISDQNREYDNESGWW